MIDLGIEAVSRFSDIAVYGRVYLIEFRDYTRAIVLTDEKDTEESFVIDEEGSKEKDNEQDCIAD